MRKIIHKDWLMDISHIRLNEVEENSYFSDNFFAKYTYPFEFIMDDYPQFLYHYNESKFKKTYDNLILETKGKLEECKLLILSVEGKKVTAQLIVGFDDFPNFGKKLSELPLHKFNLSGQNLYDHANSIVNKKYPETDYNFPAIHTDLVSTDNHLFSEFKGTYNLYKDGYFVRNTIKTSENNEIMNYNLMLPAVSVIYLLKTGFEEAGYSLIGTILQSELLSKLWVFKGNTFSSENYPAPTEWIVDKTTSENNQNTFYRDQQGISFNGTFRIKGIAYIRGWKIQEIKDLSTGKKVWESVTMNNTEPVDVTINTTKDTILEFYAVNGVSGTSNNRIAELMIIPITILDENGKVINPNFDTNEINLKKNVPDITFGDFVRALKNTFNLDLERESKSIIVNFIEPEIRNITVIDNLGNYEIIHPKIQFNEDLSFLLKFQHEDENYPFDSIYVDKNGAYTSNYSKLENTQEISSPVIPLPLILRNNLNSAKSISEDANSIQLILYSGLSNQKNETLNNSPLLWRELYEEYWKEWLEFRINSDTFIWKFTALKEKLSNLSVKKKIWAYNRLHMIKKISRQDLSIHSEEIEIETQSE
jgi:hypothetical protein